MEIELWLIWATLAVVSLLYYLANPTRRAGIQRMPPGPTPLPVIGNLLCLRGGNLHHTLARLARADGPVMTLKLGLTTAVVVSSRDAAREAFTRQDRRLAARAVPDAARGLGFADRSMVWLPSSDPLWKSLRGIAAAHAFSPRALAAARGVRERKVRDMVSYFRGCAGTEVDVGQAMYAGVLNLVSSALCSVDVVDMGAAESGQGVRELVEDLVAVIAKPNVSDLVPFLRRLDLQGWRRWSAIRIGKIFRILDGIIDSRMAFNTSTEEKHGDFLDVLLELFSTGKIARDSLTAILFDLFTAGSDTMAITVEWAMAELLRNPGVMAKVRAELDDTLGGKETIVETDVAGLPYLQAVVKEAMRLHQVAPILLPHRAEEEGVEIGGYAVPKGSTVIFNVWAIMRDPAAWERPDEFVPERFLGRAEADQVLDFRGKAFEFIPFGSGRRLCPGVPMAERVVPFILASLLRAFEWRLPDGMLAEELDVSERFTTANVMAVPLKAVPVVVT
ncbi:cytochrome P450 76M5-like [Triticum dicoccoides]|uniref:cytochrome P450 76M5-like n=1 Tax=Triticum dicoccoides TaxID=85692 RepID=UPI00188F1EF3|nr:cytochrome P450 76M5-like [Triticum dicoccoides]